MLGVSGSMSVNTGDDEDTVNLFGGPVNQVSSGSTLLVDGGSGSRWFTSTVS